MTTMHEWNNAIREFALARWEFDANPRSFENCERLAKAYRPTFEGLRAIRNADERFGDPHALDIEWEVEWQRFASEVAVKVSEYRKTYCGHPEIEAEGKKALVADVLYMAHYDNPYCD